MSAPTVATTPRAALRAGADLVERVGLHRREMWKGAGTADPYDGGPVCALGSLWVVTGCELPDGDTVEARLVRRRAAKALRQHLDSLIGEWNDEPERTPRDVAEAMRAAAETAGER